MLARGRGAHYLKCQECGCPGQLARATQPASGQHYQLIAVSIQETPAQLTSQTLWQHHTQPPLLQSPRLRAAIKMASLLINVDISQWKILTIDCGRLSSQHRSAPAGAKLSFRDSSARCPGRASRPFSPPSRSSQTAGPSIRRSSKTTSDSSTNPSMSSTWSSSPTASPTSSKTSTPYISLLRSSPAPARTWRNVRS